MLALLQRHGSDVATEKVGKVRAVRRTSRIPAAASGDGRTLREMIAVEEPCDGERKS